MSIYFDVQIFAMLVEEEVTDPILAVVEFAELVGL